MNTVNHPSGQYQKSYYDANGQSGDRPALKLFTRLARRYIAPGQVVDFGCGTGSLLDHLKVHFDVQGIESSDWARQAAAERTGLPVHASTTELKDASLSGIVSIHVVEHIEDASLRLVLTDWYRALRPGGRVLVVTPDAAGFAARHKEAAWIAFTDPTHINLKTHDEWVALFDATGFRCLYGFADGLWDFPYLFPLMGKAEVFLLGWPTLAQFILARPLLPAGSGESSIFVLEKPA